MRYSDFKIVETANTDTNNTADDTGTEVVSQELAAGPPYPPEDTEKVKALQSRLQQIGYSVGSTGVDGKYGPRTTAAVRAFKKDYNLPGGGLSIDAQGLDTLGKVISGSIKQVSNPTPTGTSAAGGEIGQLAQDSVTQGKVGAILDLIAGPESGGRYDAVYPGRRRPEILDMTLAELYRDQRARGNATGSSASGRYQYIRKTLQGVAKSMGLDPNTTKFDEKTQDDIAIYHLRLSHGLDKWLAGRMDDKDFLDKLAGTWAGIPNRSGRSTHAGVLDNAAGISTNTALAALQDIKGSTSA